MKNVIFDMETGDPDDIITLLMLLANPEVNLKAVTCYQGSPLQIGLIEHVISNSGKDIPVAGWNTVQPSEISPYYSKLIGAWKSNMAKHSPVELYHSFLTEDTLLLTGAPLTNIALFLQKYPQFVISKMISQGGYLGNIVKDENQLPKFKGRKAIQTYNLSSDVSSYDTVKQSTSIEDLTFITKDLCHGFVYQKSIHDSINFKNDFNSQLLKKALGHYADNNKKKAMHDPLAMLYMLYPEIGNRIAINMNYTTEDDKYLFSSVIEHNTTNTYGLIDYDSTKSWELFKNICSLEMPNKKVKNEYK